MPSSMNEISVRTWEYVTTDSPALLSSEESRSVGIGTDVSSLDSEIFRQEACVREELQKLFRLRRQRQVTEVKNYELQVLTGSVSLAELFDEKKELVVVHNAGMNCSDSTLWADGLNGVVKHVEDRAAFVLINNDKPEDQYVFSKKRGWTFKIASARGTTLSDELGFYDAVEKTWSLGLSILSRTPDRIVANYRVRFGRGDWPASFWALSELISMRSM